MPIVSNTGPLLSFSRANRLSILREVAGELIIPDAVYEEIVTHGAGRPGVEDAQEGSWIRRESVRDPVTIAQISEGLDPGERDALALASELGATLLVDDLAARREALRLGVPHFGSLRVLKEAKDRGIVPEVKPVLDDLIAAGMYISNSLYRSFLHEMHEE